MLINMYVAADMFHLLSHESNDTHACMPVYVVIMMVTYNNYIMEYKCN